MTALNKQALREAAQEEIMLRSAGDTSDAWQDEASPEAVLALLDGLEAAEKRIAEQREYYEGVIADGSRRMAELEAKIETADKLQDSAFRHGLQHGFSYGQTNDQAGYEQCLKSYSSRGKDNG
ncbi:ead/Ea22-like family protein [Citrobacter freundii]|uniref:ead/Ea22-like family protein n=1 Tax=Citrobacter freundii TaxID=546 RepID=UPI0018FF6BDD|nr:ead/Ea22-like family protein [Citrobacter freundii]MCQ7059724.1 ead/Ea22-like family protein [Escherichia coli]EKU9299183.1 ead/Ea22-like family protein [Citrobacter freundii]EKZ2444222.1 ead/Ea22-like family protein [Citrobacter freundii]MBJ9100109.1 ead/Ea22-like family protein [Citrobacter freundii]MBJ9118382.1 ead/Ea22-like family protein [Citrobacter freundii]